MVIFCFFQDAHASLVFVEHNWAIWGPGGIYGIWEYSPNPKEMDGTSAIMIGPLGSISFPCDAYTLSFWTIFMLIILIFCLLFFKLIWKKKFMADVNNQNNIPKCIPVIGCLWIVFATLIYIWGVSVFAMHNPFGRNTNVYDYCEAIIKICFAILACISSLYFFRKKYWSRTILEILTWVLLVYIVYEGISFMKHISWNGTREFGPLGIFTTIAITMLYVYPISLILKSLRSERVKLAMNNTSN